MMTTTLTMAMLRLSTEVDKSSRQALTTARRWVIKIGSAILTDNGQGLSHEFIARLASDVIALREQGREVIIVSSGAVAAGLARLGLDTRPSALDELQAAAAVGQSSLVQAYEAAFAPSGYLCAQILLSHDDVKSRDRYLNARATLQTLLDKGVIPIVNENDTVVTDEIRFGDNDTLAALVANLIDADALLMLTDQQGLFNADPRTVSDATLIQETDAHDTSLDAMVSEGSTLGRGGMVSKLRAARWPRALAHSLLSPTAESHRWCGTLLMARSPVRSSRRKSSLSQRESSGLHRFCIPKVSWSWTRVPLKAFRRPVGPCFQWASRL